MNADGTKSEIVTQPDGSTMKTDTNADGTKTTTQTVQNTDGSK